MKKETLNRSCLRWPGNKYSLLKQIKKILPGNYKNYHEPFFGSGSIFLNICIPNNAFISDSNVELMNFYVQVQSNLNNLLACIRKKENTEKYFYQERDKKYINLTARAAQLYYLNRTCFNGIYRVNSTGKFNVPYGKRENFNISDVENLKFLNKKLNGVTINAFDFEKSIEYIKKGDLVYFDPPYSSKTNSNNFLMYNEKLFKWNDQLRLQKFCKQLIDKKVYIVLNNLYNEEVYKLFANDLELNAIITERYSGIGSKLESRGTLKEYLFTNMK